MIEFPYTQVVGKIKLVFEKIPQVGIPNSVDKKWLASIGLSGSNDTTLVPVLKFIGFVDQSVKPTERWTSYRNKSMSKKVMAQAIKDGYSELFNTYDDAYQRSDEELRSFFATRNKAGAQVISKTVSTFRALCALADFDAFVPVEQDVSLPPSLPRPTNESPEVKANPKLSGPGLTININIQLTLPATTDETVYDKLFAAMRHNLFA